MVRTIKQLCIFIFLSMCVSTGIELMCSGEKRYNEQDMNKRALKSMKVDDLLAQCRAVDSVQKSNSTHELYNGVSDLGSLPVQMSGATLALYEKVPVKTCRLSDICSPAPCRPSALFYHNENDQIVVGYQNGVIGIYQTEHQTTKLFLGHNAPLKALYCSKDLLISAAQDGEVKLWDLFTQCCVATFKQEGTYPTKLYVHAFNTDVLVIGNNDGSISFYHIKRRELIAHCAGHQRAVTSIIAVSPHLLLTTSLDGSCKMWNSKSQGCIYTLELQKPLYAVTTHPENNKQVILWLDSSISMCKKKSGKQRALCKESGNPLTVVTNRNGYEFVGGYFDGTIGIWNNRTALFHKIHVHTCPISYLDVYNDTILIGCIDGTVKLGNLTKEGLFNTVAVFNCMQVPFGNRQVHPSQKPFLEMPVKIPLAILSAIKKSPKVPLCPQSEDSLAVRYYKHHRDKIPMSLNSSEMVDTGNLHVPLSGSLSLPDIPRLFQDEIADITAKSFRVD